MSEAVRSGGYMSAAERSDWRTPKQVVKLVEQAFGGSIDLDPCASMDPKHHFAKHNFSGPAGTGNGLVEGWPPRARTFVNPPFENLAPWCEVVRHFGHFGGEVILLLPSRTDTRYWHECVATARSVAFWRGRLRFEEAEASCPFPVAFAYWGNFRKDFEHTFSPYAWVVRP